MPVLKPRLSTSLHGASLKKEEQSHDPAFECVGQAVLVTSNGPANHWLDTKSCYQVAVDGLEGMEGNLVPTAPRSQQLSKHSDIKSFSALKSRRNIPMSM